jgi:hypothetical protein
VHHGGWAGGYSAYYAQLPEKKLSVIVMGNHTDFFTDLDVDNKDGGLTHNILKLLIGYEEESINDDKSGIQDGNKSAETNIDQAESDLDLSGKYMEPLSSCVWEIRKENRFYYIDDCSGNVTKILYYGNGIFKSADGRQVYTVFQNNEHIPECIRLQDGNINRTFYPFYTDKINISELKAYEGKYFCEKLGVAYNVKIDKSKLFISNENRQNNALDFYYMPAIKDTFICEHPNKYISYYCTTFNRNSDNDIISFSYRDNQKTLRENFVFMKMSCNKLK